MAKCLCFRSLAACLARRVAGEAQALFDDDDDDECFFFFFLDGVLLDMEGMEGREDVLLLPPARPRRWWWWWWRGGQASFTEFSSSESVSATEVGVF